MKKLLLLSLALPVVLQLISCSKQDLEQETPLIVDQSVRPTTPESLNAVALTVADMGLTTDMMRGIYKAVTRNVEQGTDEHIAFTDIVPGGFRAIAAETDEDVSSFAEVFKKSFSATIERTGLRGVLYQDSAFDLQSFLKEENATLYWPYSENWDGKTAPTIVVSPDSDTEELCVGYKLKEKNGKYILSEKVLVDENYALRSPVWVINREALDESSDQKVSRVVRKEEMRVKNAENPLRSLQNYHFTTLYLGTLQATKHHDAWHKGGDEYELELKAPKHREVNGQIVVENEQYAKLRECFTRREIRNKEERHVNIVLVSEWQPELKEIAIHLYENDASLFTGGKTYKLGVKWANQEYGLEVSLPFDSGDDELYSGLWTQEFVFSTGNFDIKSLTWVKHYTDGLYYTLPFKRHTVLYDPNDPLSYPAINGMDDFWGSDDILR